MEGNPDQWPARTGSGTARRPSPPLRGSPRSSPPLRSSPPTADASNMEAEACKPDMFAHLPSHIGAYDMVQPRVVLGRGSFSVVFEGLERDTLRRVAIKAVYLGPENTDSVGGFNNELRVLCRAVGHSGIVKLLDHYHQENMGYLVFDLCERGEVFSEVIPHLGLNPRENVGPYFAQLMDAVEFLHQAGICHLDIKTENMFIDSNGRVKLGDFGLGALLEDAQLLGCRGSLGYAAPENISSLVPRATCGYDGQKADIWSCGVVLFVLIYGMIPWDAARDSSAEFRVYKATDGYPNIKPWNRMPNVVRTLLHRMLAIHPGRRWTAAQVKQYIAQNMGWHVPSEKRL